MSLTLTDQALSALRSTSKEPNIVVKIDGVSKIIGASLVKKYVRIGDPDLIIGDPDADPNAFWIGGLNPVALQDNILTLNGTSTQIQQSLDIDKGESNSISNMSLALMSADGFAIQLISPGVLVPDIIGRKIVVYYGFSSTAWPEDYLTIFRGRVSDVTADAGKVTLQINSPDDQKRTNIFKKYEAKLVGAINASTTTITCDDLSQFLVKVQGPDLSYDPAFESYVRIDDEIIKYTGISGNTFTGVVRGQLGSIAASHDNEAGATAYYVLKDNGIKLALKIMSSGNVVGGVSQPFATAVPVTSINVGGPDRFDNALYFKGVDVNDEYGLEIGDWVGAVTGSTYGGNNITRKQIVDIESGEDGDFVILGGVTFTDDLAATNIQCTFISQYATLPDGCRMSPDEIDVAEHLRLYELFLNSVQYTFYVKDGIEDAREFLEQNVYMPMSAYSLPRKARSSVGYHIGPIPGTEIKTFDESNVKKPVGIKVKRSINKNFFNEILYQYDEDSVQDEFNTGYLAISATSKSRIKNSPNKTLIIAAKGLRTPDLGLGIAQAASLRRLKRYQFGAETFTFQALLQDGFSVEIGDIIILDGTNLSIPDINSGTSGMKPRLLEVQNKSFQLKTGDLTFDAVDTNFNGAARYCLIGPSSRIRSGISTTQFLIEESFAARYGAYEFRKWERLTKPLVKIRSADSTTEYTTYLQAVTSNTLTVSPALPVVPSAGMILELADYDGPASDQSKLVYGFMRNTTFADGKPTYQML